MSLGTAFRFPFSNGNFNKVLQIGIVFGLLYSVEVVLNSGVQSGTGSLIGGIGNLLFGLFTSGYSILVMQKIFRGDETLPEFEVGDSIGRGFKILLASLIYVLPIIILIILIVVFAAASAGDAVGRVFEEYGRQLSNPNYLPNLSDNEIASLGTLPLLFCGLMIVILPLSIILGFAAQIGMVRFAIEDRSGALFEFATNIRMVLSKLGSIGGLFIRQLAIGIAYFFIILIVGVTLDLVTGVDINTTNTVTVIISGVIFSLFIGVLNITQQLSNIHLLAGFAYDADLVEQSKAKNDDMEDVFSF